MVIAYIHYFVLLVLGHNEQLSWWDVSDIILCYLRLGVTLSQVTFALTVSNKHCTQLTTCRDLNAHCAVAQISFRPSPSLFLSLPLLPCVFIIITLYWHEILVLLKPKYTIQENTTSQQISE